MTLLTSKIVKKIVKKESTDKKIKKIVKKDSTDEQNSKNCEKGTLLTSNFVKKSTRCPWKKDSTDEQH